jgi:hypothetical protein
MPLLGVCAFSIVVLPLAAANLIGAAIAPIAGAVFACLAALGYRRGQGLTRSEWRESAPAMIAGLFALLWIGWPLFRSGYDNYWGLANPDEAFLIPITEWLKSHPLGMPPDMMSPDSFRGLDMNSIFPIFYLMDAASFLTSAPVGLLFNVTCLCLVYLAPGSAFAFANVAGFPRRVCIAAAAAVACSSLLAYTFYLDSLGALTVIAGMPALAAVSLGFCRRPAWRTGFIFVIVCVGLWYNYLGNIALSALVAGVVISYGGLSRSIPLRKVLLICGATILAIVSAFPAWAWTLCKVAFVQTFHSGATAPKESWLGFSFSLTERGLPLYWGLAVPGVTPWPFSSRPEVMVLIGTVLSAFLLLGCWSHFSGLPTIVRVLLSALLFVVLWYIHGNNGYGVFKLAAWIHPFIASAFVGTVFGAAGWLKGHGPRAVRWLPFAVAAIYLLPNLVMGVQLGRHTADSARSGIHNLPLVSFREVRDLANVRERLGDAPIVAFLPDSVTALWTDPFLRETRHLYLPFLSLDVEDSKPRRETSLSGLKIERALRPFEITDKDIASLRLLHWNTPSTDLAPPADCPALWANRSFAVSMLSRCRNALFFGYGWYRFERSESAGLPAFRWLRKRGELLLLNPGSEPERLRLGVVVGPGNPSPQRTLSILLNGEVIDTVTITGAATLLTPPFQAHGPLAQLEIAVKEDAQPVPRGWPIWKRWVPADVRKLNIAVTDVRLISGEDEAGAPSFLDLSSPPTALPLRTGFFVDHWIGPTASIVLGSASTPEAVRIVGTAPGGVGFSFPFQIGLTVNGEALPPCVIPRPGAFDIRCKIPSSIQESLSPRRSLTIRIDPESIFRNLPSDFRELSLRLQRIELEGVREQEREAER